MNIDPFQIFSEFIILFVASAAIFYEYRRSAAKEEAKQAAIEKVTPKNIVIKRLLQLLELKPTFEWTSSRLN